MATIQSSNIGNIDPKAITVTFADDTLLTCDVKTQILVNINGVAVYPTDVILSNPRTMGILLPHNVMIDDVIEWFYYSGTCKIEDITTHTELTHAAANTVLNTITSDLLIYPADPYDSFADHATLNSVMESLVGNTKFVSLTLKEQEVFYRQATMMIRQCPNIQLPPTAESNLVMAQAIIASSYADTNIMAQTGAKVKKEQVGDLSQEFFEGVAISATEFPSMAKGFLIGYGCTSSGGGYSQSRVVKA